MGDRTNMQITVYDCPPDQVDAVLDLIADYGLWEGDFGMGVPELTELVLGVQYGGVEVYCGSSDEIALGLVEQAPGASWEVWEDPKYEWLGSLNRYTPALGLWGAECDAEGQPQFTPDVILAKIKELGPETPIGQLEAWLGEPWQQALGAFGGNKGRRLPRKEEA